MSTLPLTGLKVLDLSSSLDGSPCARTLASWGMERIALPPGLDTRHPEGNRILLRLAQEVDVMIGDRDALDFALLQEYNPMLIVCQLAEGADAWAASSSVLAALLHRSRTGLGQHVTLPADGPPTFSAFAPQAPLAPDPDRMLERLGYDAAAITELRREGILRPPHVHDPSASLREYPAI